MSTAILCATLCSSNVEEEPRGYAMTRHSLSLMETIPLPSRTGNGRENYHHRNTKIMNGYNNYDEDNISTDCSSSGDDDDDDDDESNVPGMRLFYKLNQPSFLLEEEEDEEEEEEYKYYIHKQERCSSPIESPVTVATMEPFWKSVISVDDTGAEVTLEEAGQDGRCDDNDDDDDNGNGLYRKIGSILETHLLLSPESPGEKPRKTTAFCDFYGCLSLIPGSGTTTTRSELSGDESVRLQECILSSLGSLGESESWQMLLPSMPYNYILENGISQEEEDDLKTMFPSPHHIRVMHNRTMHTSLKSDRLHKLRRDLHPFNNKHKNDRTLHRVNSYNPPPRKESKNKNILDPLAVWNWSCNPEYMQPLATSQLMEVDQNACYDSDPEDYNATRICRPVSQQQQQQQTNESTLLSNTINYDADEVAMLSFVQHVFKERWTLIHHPAYGSPVGVEAWLERGHRLPKTTLPPKLVWLPLHEKSNINNNKCGGGGGASRRKNGSLSSLSFIDLLDIQRIVPIRRSDRKYFPLAKAGHTFVIKSVHGNFCMEAQSKVERDRLMRQFKLIVARFGSQLVSSDVGVEDFFVPLSHAKVVDPIILRRT